MQLLQVGQITVLPAGSHTFHQKSKVLAKQIEMRSDVGREMPQVRGCHLRSRCGERFADAIQQLLAQAANHLATGGQFGVPFLGRFFQEHFTVAEDVVDRRAQVMA